jgi:hypothetical protein
MQRIGALNQNSKLKIPGTKTSGHGTAQLRSAAELNERINKSSINPVKGNGHLGGRDPETLPIDDVATAVDHALGMQHSDAIVHEGERLGKALGHLLVRHYWIEGFTLQDLVVEIVDRDLRCCGRVHDRVTI